MSANGETTTSSRVKEEKDVSGANDAVKSEPQQQQQQSSDESGEKSADQKDPLIDSFYAEIDDIKTEDFKSSSREQLERLLRPGSTYFNLNPFEVLQIDPYASLEEIKKKYRKLSMYVHPDKNPGEKDRAQIAFEAVNRAYKMLDDEKERKMCLEVVDEARERVDKMCEEKRKKLKKELNQQQAAAAASQLANSKKSISGFSADPPILSDKIDEDDPDKYRHAIYVMTCKLFADIERLKVREMEKKAEEKKRKAEEKAGDESKSKVQKEWDKNYEATRQGRVSSWQTFSKKGSSASSAAPVARPVPVKTGFKPPKHKPETR